MRKVARFVYLFLFISGLLVSFSSCGSSNSDDETPSVTTPTTDGNNLQPEDQKQKLENVGLTLSNEINPSDYQQVIKALDDFNSYSSSPSFRSAQLRSVSTSLRSVAATSDLNELVGAMRSATVSSYYTSHYASFNYNSNTGQWDSTYNAGALVYKYPSQNQQATITLQVSNDYYTFIQDGETMFVPKSLTYTLKLSSNVVMSYTLNVPTFNRTTGVMTMNDQLNVPSANLVWSSNMDVTSSHSSATATIKKGSSTLISASADVVGANMSTASTLDANTFNKGVVKINVLDKIYFTFECSNIAEYSSKINLNESQNPWISNFSYVQNDSYTTTSYWEYYRPEAYYKNYSDLNNQYLLGYLNYDNSSNQVAKLYFDYKYDVRTQTVANSYYPPYKYISTNKEDFSEILPGIQFISDGSRYKYFDYFNNNNFASFVKTFDDLTSKFDAMLK